MQAPPPAGWTGRAPPPGDGGSGATLDEAPIVLLGGLPAVPTPPAAKASAAAPPHNAAKALPLRFVIVIDSSFCAPDPHKRNAAYRGGNVHNRFRRSVAPVRQHRRQSP
jgi:hypothetical protein